MNSDRNVTKWTIRGSIAAAMFAAMMIGGATQAYAFEFPVSGNGSAQGPDREATLDEAFENASEQVRLICSGGAGQIRHDRIDRTGHNCVSVGDGDSKMYSCMAFVRASCVSGR
jgi:hypothetical protein